MESTNRPTPSISILLVEDVPVTLELLATILPRKFPDIALHTAFNGRTGLEIFKTCLPDIVITDINMPEMDGAQMAERIRKIKPETKLIVITGDTGRLARRDSAGTGFEADRCIVKPVGFEALFSAIEECLDEIGQRRP